MNWQPAINKLFSGKYFLTVVTGLVFVYAACNKLIDNDVIATIVAMVFSLYFSRKNGEQPPKGA